MRKLRFLRWLCSLSLVASLLSGVAFGAGIPNLDDLGIEPWRDYNNLPTVLPTASPASSSSPQDWEGDSLYTLDSDADIMTTAVDLEPPLSFRWGGFVPYGTDEDGDEWEGIPALDTFPTSPFSPSEHTFTPSDVIRGGNLYMTGRRSNPQEGIAPSDKPWYLGRQFVINGDPNITNRSNVSFRGGYVLVDVPVTSPVDSARSFQVLDANFHFGVRFGGWSNPSDTGRWPDYNMGTNVDYAQLSEIHVIINGKDVGPIDYTTTPVTISREKVRFYFTHISGVVNFDEQRVNSVSLAFVFSGATWTRGTTKLDNWTGGLAVTLIQPKLSNGAWGGLYQSGGQYVLSSDSAAENSGLLKSIIEFLQNIVNGITNVAQQIAHLPGLIADEIMGRLRSLFVPTAEDIEAVKEKYITLLEERLGFLWQAMTFITDTAQKFLAALEGSSDYVFNLPALTITLPSGEVTIVQAQTISFDNALFTTVRTAAGTMFSFVIVLGFLNVSEKMVVAIVSGKSYFDYLKGGEEE